MEAGGQRACAPELPRHFAAMHHEPIERSSEAFAVEARINVMEAIARRLTLEASYNGEPLRLAPHQLFERHGDLFLAALNLKKAWRSDDERRLGVFKLVGLGAPEVLDETFDPLASYEAAPPRADDRLILTI